jgi:hypothetical protein
MEVYSCSRKCAELALKRQRCLQDELELEMRRLELRNEALRLDVLEEELKLKMESHVEPGGLVNGFK